MVQYLAKGVDTDQVEALSGPATPPMSVHDADEHLRARSQVFELIRAVQLGGTLSLEIVDEIRGEGTRRGWPDVVKLGLYLSVIYERHVDRRVSGKWVELLLERAESDGDALMTALALAVRSQDIGLGGRRASFEADRDLARAIALLEGWSGPSREAVSAHIECARSCELRDLWELQLAHYQTAEACIDWAQGGEEKLPVLLFNRAELQVNWVAALRERGGSEDLALHAEQARAALDAADIPLMPDRWRTDVRHLRELLEVIAPSTGTLRHPTTETGRGRCCSCPGAVWWGYRCSWCSSVGGVSVLRAWHDCQAHTGHNDCVYNHLTVSRDEATIRVAALSHRASDRAAGRPAA